MRGRYILLDGQPVPCDNVLEWAQWFETSDETRRIERTQIAEGVEVSTVFMGLDHSFGEGPPLLYETMVFGGRLDEETERYSTVKHALEGHDQMVKRVRAAMGEPESDILEGPIG